MGQPPIALAALGSLAGVVGSFALAWPYGATSAQAYQPRAALAFPVAAAASAESSSAERAPAELQDPMHEVPGGLYRPFFRSPSGAPALTLARFWLDAAPVSQQQFATFVQQQARWRRTQVEPLFAEGSYLSDWQSDLVPSSDARTTPVVFVSWFAARAYCAWQGKRLPSGNEWEYAAGSVPALQLVSAAAAPALWEWTLDFNSLPVDGGDGAGTSANLFCGAGARAREPRDYTAFLRFAFRSSLKASYALKNLGFRCARGATK
jgi:formylglycine-generating enzyme required for sulfatase activity